MLENALTLLHGSFLLLFGISLTAAFSGIRPSKRNVLIFLGLFVFSGVLQLGTTLVFSEDIVWKLYPIIAHLPLILLLCLVYRKHLATAAASAFTAYLCCQPSKWIGIIVYEFSSSAAAELAARIVCLILFGYLAIFYLSFYFSIIFNKDWRSVCVFGFVPIIYYIFDYAVVVYTDLWLNNDRAVAEFMPVFLAVTYIVFCLIYYREYEQKADAQHKEQIIRISVEQQKKEIEAIRKSNHETALLRHDMRHLLSNLALIIKQDDKDNALKLISGYVSEIESAALRRYCENDTVNYILTNFENKCSKAGVSFQLDLEMDSLTVDEIMFSSIISNALDNALNAQLLMPEEERYIKLMLKSSDGKLLLSVKNPFLPRPPQLHKPALRSGHGYGTQSIIYLTEKLGGKCRFSAENNVYILRVIL